MDSMDMSISILKIITLFLILFLILDIEVIKTKPDVVQHWNSDKMNYCSNKFVNDENITIHHANGISMNPTIYQDNKLVCDRSIKTYKEGMIVSTNGVSHRIYAVYPDYILTKGDNNNAYDDAINVSDIDCVVIAICY